MTGVVIITTHAHHNFCLLRWSPIEDGFSCSYDPDMSVQSSVSSVVHVWTCCTGGVCGTCVDVLYWRCVWYMCGRVVLEVCVVHVWTCCTGGVCGTCVDVLYWRCVWYMCGRVVLEVCVVHACTLLHVYIVNM